MHAREWSCASTVEGMGPHLGLVYQTFIPLPVGVTDGSIYRAMGGTCTGHKDKTKLPHKMLLPPGRFGYTTMTFGGHSAVTPGIHTRPASRPFLQGARMTIHCWSMCQNVQGQVYSPVSPGLKALGAGSRVLLCWPYPGLNNSSLAWMCNCIIGSKLCEHIHRA